MVEIGTNHGLAYFERGNSQDFLRRHLVVTFDVEPFEREHRRNHWFLLLREEHRRG